MRKCKGPCGKPKPLEAFELKRNGYRRRTCMSCRNAAYDQKNPGRRVAYSRQYRKNNPHKFIVIDSRSSDRKAGLQGNDLDSEFVASMIQQGCSYCGGASLRMTVDRKDNTKPHTKTNVVPCCLRCNYMRGSMPYEAWVHLVPAVREAYEKGLFGSWRTEPLNRR